MKLLNPYVIWQLVRAVLILFLVMLIFGFIFPVPGLVLLGGDPVVIMYAIGTPLSIIGIAASSVYITRYGPLKPVSNKKNERIYGIIGITLIVLATLTIVISQVVQMMDLL